MEPKLISICSNVNKPIIIKKWKVRKGMPVSQRQILLLYQEASEASSREVLKFKATDVGSVHEICVQEGVLVQPGDVLLMLEECSHPTVMRDMCAECGADLRQSESVAVRASVPMVHSIPELKVSEELAQHLGKADEVRLLNDRKLVLLVDLDQTLVHTTNDNIPPNLKHVVHFQLYGPQSPWYHTRIRPGTNRFLEAASELYELHICTFGARNYAHYIAMFLDPDGRFFSHRILSRDECFDANSKTANLRALFPCGDSMVCIIDDREDVWNYAPNLIHVKPYHFFQHTGDIHAPPGLTKTDNDSRDEGFDFSVFEDGEVKDGELKDGDKKPSKVKAVASGETTTDKDTEDESESKALKTGKSEATSMETITEEVILSDKSASHEKPIESTEEGKEGKEVGIESVKTVENGEMQEDKNEEETPKCSKVADSNVKEPPKNGNNSEVTKENDEDVKVQENGIKKNALEVNIEKSEEKESDEKKKDDLSMEIEQCNKAGESGPEKEPEATEEIKGKIEGPDGLIETEKGIKVIESGPEKEPEATEKIKGKSEGPDGHIETEQGIRVRESGPEKEPEVAEKMKGKSEGPDGLIEVEDSDDYLLYLEDILKKIHQAYYKEYDKCKGNNGPLPDLKTVIPAVKGKVLEGCELVFSGLVPSHVPLERSRAFQVAKSLGATVRVDLTPTTTHLVAARAGTAKVNASRRQKGVLVVTPDWLWHCAERWEHIDERIYPLARGTVTSRHPPAHCSTPQQPQVEATPQRFVDTINPLLTLTSEEVARMDKEVADLCADSEESDSDDAPQCKPIITLTKPSPSEDEEESDDSLAGGHSPKGWTEDGPRRKRKFYTTTCTESDLEEDSPSAKFRRGEPLPSDLDLGDNETDTQDDSQDDSQDDAVWNLAGAALEREFLSEK